MIYLVSLHCVAPGDGLYVDFRYTKKTMMDDCATDIVHVVHVAENRHLTCENSDRDVLAVWFASTSFCGAGRFVSPSCANYHSHVT